MGSISVRGRILTLFNHTKGYTVLHIQQNVPFKSKYLKFYLLDVSMLGDLKEGDDVLVSYHYQGHMTALDTIERSVHVECHRCKTFIEEIKQMEFDCCEKAVKRRYINKQLELVEKMVKNFKFSKGLCLKFVDGEGEYRAIIFENSPLFTKLSDVEPLKSYTVAGWEESMYDNIDIVQMI